MEQTAEREADRDPRQDFPIVIATMPATKAQQRLALGVVVLLVVIAAIIAPFGHVQLARIDAFIPVIQTVMCVADFITAVLLLAQYSIQPRSALLALASGYIFSGSFAFLQTLAFPGAYSPGGLIGDGSNSPGWLFVLWQTTFPLAVVAYTLTKEMGDPAPAPGRSSAPTIATTVGCVLLATAGLAWLATAGAAYLPLLYVGGPLRQAPLAQHINLFMFLWSMTALVLLFARRRTILDMWLVVTLIAWMPDFVGAFFLTTVRFSLVWYVARGYALVASCTVLCVLLTETTLLYSRLASAMLLQRRERASRLMSVQAATGAMAHEIRQPLQAISANHQAALLWLKKMPPKLEEVSACLKSIGEATERANQMISGVLGLVKKATDQRRMIEVDDVARQALHLVQHDLQINLVSVTTKFQAGLPRIHADPTQLQQVILNLARNAMEAMGSIIPNARHLHLTTALGANSEVLILIGDTGPGLSADQRDRAFDPFFTTKSDGMGLGLAISRSIVEAHGGDLRLRKTGSQGTTFEIALPVGAAHSGSG